MTLQKWGGLAAILEALIYISMFLFWGAFLAFPSDATVDQKLAFLVENQLSISIMNIVGFVLFGVLLAVLVQALRARLEPNQKELIQLSTLFGYIWVGLIVAGGMISNLGLQSIIEISNTEPENFRAVWLANSIVEEGLGGGIEVVGGLWMFFLSVAALKSAELPKGLSYLGLVLGTVGILTLYPAETLTEIFGLGQIIWFTWLGIFMLRNS